MNSPIDLGSIMAQIGRDKGIDRQLLVEAVESAMLSAARKHFGHSLNLEAKFNEDTGEVEVVQFRVVVDEVQDLGSQISFESARAQLDPDAMVGDEIGERLDTAKLGRIAAQTAKQVIIQKLRDAERGVIYEEYKNQKGELVNGIVQRFDRGNLVVNLGRTEAVVPRREQILRERYRQGDRIRCMILDIDRSARGPQIILTRSHPEFLKKLFSIEVPEIAEQVVEIKAVAREPGERSKIAVISNDSAVDPVGACVGIKGSRVQAVVQELRGERIDIITWTPDEPSFVARALSPAVVNRVVVDEDQHSIEVIVNDDQLALAIGRRGQNVRLASKLTGWRLDVRSVSVADEESKRARSALELIPDITFTEAELLFQAGFRSPREVADASIDDITALEGFSESRASELMKAAASKAEELEANPEVLPVVTDLDRLALPPEFRDRLIAAGFTTIQSLVTTDPGELLANKGFSEEDTETVKTAMDAFFRSGVAARLAERNLAALSSPSKEGAKVNGEVEVEVAKQG
jgi:N utilization substance protein A